MKKILSIAIPTFNREKYLLQELECIIPQLLPHREEVEIVVSDNASTDNTGEMIAAVSKEYDFPIKYVKLEKGIYFEDNFTNAVNHAEGKYIQLTGDDDLMAPTFYSELFKLMREGHGLIHFNRLVCDVNCCNGKPYDKHYDQTITRCSAKEFVARVGSGPGFMTSLVFTRECWDEGLKYANKLYYGYNFLGQLYQGALHLNATCCYYYFPMVLQRGNAHGFNKTYALYHFVALPSLLKDANEEYAQQWVAQHLGGKSIHILADCYQNKQYYQGHADEMELFLTPKQKRIFRFMISKHTPRILCRIYSKWLTCRVR